MTGEALSRPRASANERLLVVIKGAGDLATGVAHRLFRCGMQVIMTEVEEPTVVRRTVAFAEAVYDGEAVVEGVRAKRAKSCEEALKLLDEEVIPIIVDPLAEVIKKVKPNAVVDAIMAKKNVGTRITDAPIVVALGPGFTAGLDAHAVVETKRGHGLGRVILQGRAEEDTGVPGSVEGYTVERVLRAPESGILTSTKRIGDHVEKGTTVGFVASQAVITQISGVLRGIIHDGFQVKKGQKIGDVDPRDVRKYCFTISDKSRAVAGGVLETILSLRWQHQRALK